MNIGYMRSKGVESRTTGNSLARLSLRALRNDPCEFDKPALLALAHRNLQRLESLRAAPAQVVPGPQDLERIGLTPREAEVLHWVMKRKTGRSNRRYSKDQCPDSSSAHRSHSQKAPIRKPSVGEL